MSPGPVQLLILLAVVVIIFGGKRLRTLGSDMGTAIKGFKTAMNEDDKKADEDKDSIEKKED